MSLSVSALIAFSLLSALAQPRDARQDEVYLEKLNSSAARIEILWSGKPVDRPPPGISNCAKDILNALLSDRAEILSGGTLVNNGQRIGTRHRFLYPLDASVRKLRARLTRSKDGRLDLTVQAFGENSQTIGPPLFQGSARENPCEPLPIDLIRWMELAGPGKPKIPAGEANR